MRKVKKAFFVIFLVIFANVSFASFSSAEMKNENFVKAQELVEQGRYSEAIEKFKLAIKVMPNIGALYMHLGKAYNEVNEFELAERNLQRAVSLGVRAGEVAFEMGNSYEKLGYYNEAIAQYKIALGYENEKGKVHFRLGYCFYRLRKYGESENNFGSAVALDEKLAAKVKLYKGIIKFEQQKYDEAYMDLTEARDTAIEDNTRISAKYYISAINGMRRAARNYSLAASMSVVYDDNVVTVNNSEPVNISDKADIGGVGYLRAMYYPVKNDSNTLVVGYMFYNKFYQDLSEYNLMNHNGIVNYTTMTGNSNSLTLRYDYNYYILDNTRYFQKNRIKPVLSLNGNKSTYLEINALVEYSDYFSQCDLDSLNVGGGFRSTVKFDSGGTFYLALDYNDDDTISKDYEYKGRSLGIGISQPVFAGLTMSFEAGYYKKEYNNLHSFYTIKRDDEVKTAFLKFDRNINDYFSASLGYDYTFNDSNITEYDYRRNVATFEIRYTY